MTYEKRLSVVIPTTAQRQSIFKTINSVFEDVDFSRMAQVEVVVNSLEPNAKIINRLAADKRIHLRFSDRFHETAEASAFYATKTSSSPWVWILGDDDLVAKGAIAAIEKLTEYDQVDFWLLNVKLKFDQIPIHYYRVGPSKIQISDSIEIWKKLGFFSALTTLSCFLIKRDILNLDIFNEFHEIQGIYSHSFSLLSMLRNKKAGITDSVCVIRTEQSEMQVAKALQSYCNRKNISLDEIYTTGALKLFDLLSIKLGVPRDDLLDFREIEIIKESRNSYVRDSDLQLLVSTSRNTIQRWCSHCAQPETEGYNLKRRNQGSESLVLVGPIRICL